MKKFLFISVLFLSSNQIWSQNKITINADPRIDTLIQRTLSLAEKESILSGFRIQLYSGSNRQLANQIKSQFMQSYPEYRAYLSYTQPYFKIRVGDFRNRAEALYLFNLLKQDGRFKTLMMVPDKIELPPIN